MSFAKMSFANALGPMKVEPSDDSIWDKKLTYLEDIKKFNKVCGTENFEMFLTCENLNVEETSRERFQKKILADYLDALLERLERRLYLMGCLPKLLENNCKILRRYLDWDQVEVLMNSLGSRNVSNTAVRQIISATGKSLPMELYYGFEIIVKHDSLYEYVRKHKMCQSSFLTSFISEIEQFRTMIRPPLLATAKDEHDKVVELKAAYMRYKASEARIKILEEQLRNEEERFIEKHNRKRLLAAKYRHKIEKTLNHFKDETEELLFNSERYIVSEKQKSDAHIAELKLEAEQSHSQYQNLIESNINEEKILRTKKNKTEAHLESWIGKYDQDVGEKQNELDGLNAQLDSERQELWELECLIQEQENRYLNYKKEKEDEEERIFKENLDNYIMNRAAKVIQRAWRMYKARKMAKRKSKKGKGKDKGKGKAGKKM